MSILNIIEDAKNEILTIRHPLREADVELKLSYLAGIVITTAHGNSIINFKLESLLFNMALSLDLSEEVCFKTIEKCLNPDKELIKEIVESLGQTYIQILFLLDAYTLMNNAYDEEIQEVKQIMVSFMQMFKFTETEFKGIDELKFLLFQKKYNEFSAELTKINEVENNKNEILEYFFPDEFKLQTIQSEVNNKNIEKTDAEEEIVEKLSKNEELQNINLSMTDVKQINCEIRRINQQIDYFEKETEKSNDELDYYVEQINNYNSNVAKYNDRGFFSMFIVTELQYKVNMYQKKCETFRAAIESNNKKIQELMKKKEELEGRLKKIK